MRTLHRDPSHVPKDRRPVVVVRNEEGELEVRCNTPERTLLGTFPNQTMVDIFLEAVTDLCGCRYIPEAELVAA